MNRKKTVFIYANQGFAVRYILQSDIFTKLKDHVRIVILSHNADEKSFVKQFKSENVLIKKFFHERCAQWLKNKKIQKLFLEFRAFVLNGNYDTRTIDDFRKIYLAQRGWTKQDGLTGRIKGFVWESIASIFKKCRLLRKTLIWVESKFLYPRFHGAVFEKYKPSLVIVNALCGFQYNELLAREAKSYHVPVCCVVLSWDNTTGMGMPGYEPDHVISWTQKMKQELIELNDIDENKIAVGGVAHFDCYYDKQLILSKKILCEKLKLDENKKIIFYATKSPKRFPWGPELVKDVADAIDSGRIDPKSQLLVRIHPLHYRRIDGKLIFQNILDQYSDLERKYNCIRLNIPSVVSEKMDFNLAQSEQILVAGILKNSDVMLNMFSTMVIEAAIFDTPSINVCIQERCKADYKKSRQDIMIDYVQTHNRRVIETNGVKTVFTMDELFNAIDAYLKAPGLDSENRDIIVKNEAGPYQGNAGEMIANQILSFIK
jgi:hypothetical protein